MNMLVEYKRQGITEVTKFGTVCWVHGRKVLHLCGTDSVIYARSTAKPFHMKGLCKDLESLLTWEEKALSVASHNAEAVHLEVLQGLVKKGKGELLLPPSRPMHESHGDLHRHFHPCSGEHSAILCACKVHGWSSDYTSEQHPFHERFVSTIGKNWHPQQLAVDGCGLLTASFSISELATLYASLVRDKDKDWIWEAMTRNPHLVGGTDRLDTDIMKTCEGKVLAKEGADGLLGLSIQHKDYPDGLGIFIKLAHGNDTQAMRFIACKTLESLGWTMKAPQLFRQDVHFNEELIK